jgi:hexosaminidase
MIKKILIGLFLIILVLLAGGYGYYRLKLYTPPLISDEDRASVTLMPLPAKLELNDGAVDLSNGFNIRYIIFSDDQIADAVDRFLQRMELKTGFNIQVEHGIEFKITYSKVISPDTILTLDDESYLLNIDKNAVELSANSQYGIYRGLESILQLTTYRNNKWILPFCKVEDHPRFPWRGLMLDVCRHWMPKDVILRTLDAMSTVKMNVFHWHLSDDQGFRVESKVFPKLHEIGSKGKYYTQEDIREVIAYAAYRGIRIVPEFDLPGHSKSWQIAYPQLSSVDFPLSFGSKSGEIFSPPINPIKDSVYIFLDRFVGEMATLFPDPYFHIGGDEVNPKYWNEHSGIQKFMQENGMNNHHDLQAYFNKRMHGILAKHGKLMLGWDEILHPDLTSDIVVQSWRSHKSLFEAVQKGGTAILSSGYYLDHILPAGKHYDVDPMVLVGAVDIEPDTGQWQMYDLQLDLAGNEMESQLVIFDRDPENVYGFFAMIDGRTAFKNGTIEGDQLRFTFLGPVGAMDYEATINNDSIEGKLSFGLLGFDAYGIKTGGSDMPGTIMPEIEVIKPLTTAEKSRIIGGEACQWAEFVDSTNVESRIWPRTGAIAEKLWSPQQLTEDTEDMYRRIEVLSKQLTKQGSHHEIQYRTKLKKLISTEGLPYLLNLTDLLEEVKYHGRMPTLLREDSIYLPDFALDRIVDAVKPESMRARQFNKLVDRFMENEHTAQKKKLINQLKQWQYNHELLMPYISISDELGDVENISLELSVVSENVIAILDDRQPNLSKELLLTKLSFLETGENGLLVAVVPGLRKIIMQF